MAEELNDQNNEEAGNSHEETAIDQKKGLQMYQKHTEKSVFVRSSNKSYKECDRLGCEHF